MATPRQIRRRGRFALITAVLVGALALGAVALGAVTTDQTDYYPGTVVTIRGDNTNGAGYVPGNPVDVAVSGPKGWSASCAATVGDDGSWSCQVTLDPDPLVSVGSYSYTAASTAADGTSTITENGAFTDSKPPTTTSLTVTPGHSTGTAGQVYYGDTLTFSGTVTSASTVTGGSIDVKQSKERKANLCASADFSGNKIDIYTQNITAGTYSSGAFTPVLSAFPTNSIASSHYAIVDALNPPLVPDPLAYASAVGTYAFETSYDWPGTLDSSDSTCVQVNVVQAPTTTSNSHTANNGTANHIYYGQSDTVNYVVASIYGVTGNTMGGTVALTRTDALSTSPNCSAAQSISKAETTGSGFSFNSSTGDDHAFTCTPHQATATPYTLYAGFADNADDAATNPDGNYASSDASGTPLSLYVDKAPTTTEMTNTPAATINLGDHFGVNYTVSSKYGIKDNTTGGSVSMTEVSGPASSLGCGASQAVSETQADADGGASEVGFSKSSSFTCTPTQPGTYTYHVTYSGDDNYQGSNSSPDGQTQVISVLPPTSFTSAGLCPLKNGSTADQFRLIYTPDPTSGTGKYKLNASNPGQFSYNIAYAGAGSQTITVPAWIKSWFVTQGAMPVQIYASATTLGNGCVQPGTLLASGTLNGSGNVDVPALSGGGAYITIHLDYRYKGYSNCTRSGDSATCTSPGSVTIASPKTYGTVGSHTITSVNVFKADPGIGGLFTQGGNPIQGASVQISDGSGNVLATVTTDQDGWYMWNYKYTGKAATFTLTLLSPYGGTQTPTLKSNGFLVVNFIQ